MEVQDIINNVVLGALSFAFTAWAGVVWRGLRHIADKFDALKAYVVATEKRLTVLEQQLIEKNDERG